MVYNLRLLVYIMLFVATTLCYQWIVASGVSTSARWRNGRFRWDNT